MIIDFRTLDDGALIEADLCVMGGGAAGITLVREFLGSSIQVCMVESGGLDIDPDVQDLYTGETVGLPYALELSRLRFFGGSTNHWAGYCSPLTPLDFQERSWVPHSGWPITYEELDPFYRRAQPVCQLGDYAYRGDELWPKLDLQPGGFDPGEIEHWFWQNSPPTRRRFGEVYRAELERAPNVRLLLNANATEIRTDEQAAAVQQVELRTLEGKRGRIRASAYVLACGGIENARLLLLSDAVERAGLGNRHDLVGRFFMEHPHTTVGMVMAGGRDHLAKTYRGHWLGEVRFEPKLCAGPAMQARERVLNSGAFLRRPDAKSATPGLAAARQLWGAVRRGRLPDDLADDVWTVMRNLDDVMHFVYGRLGPGQWRLFMISEQAPNPDSRVTLAEARDALGQRRARLDWRLGELDKRSIVALSRTIAMEIARLGLGRVRLEDWLLDSGPAWPQDVEGGDHHMGTTRMAAEPKRGVADTNCRVHFIDNLYIAGSSVFPTGGCTNPTLTIVALALRLADHLKLRLV